MTSDRAEPGSALGDDEPCECRGQPSIHTFARESSPSCLDRLRFILTVSESPTVLLFVFDLVLFREVEQLLLDSILEDAREGAAVCDSVEHLFERLVTLGEERSHELLVGDIDFTGFRVTSVFEVVLQLLDLRLQFFDL